MRKESGAEVPGLLTKRSDFRRVLEGSLDVKRGNALDLSFSGKHAHFYGVIVKEARCDPGPFQDCQRRLDSDIFNENPKQSEVIKHELLKGGLPGRLSVAEGGFQM